jgi:replicative DNA helicase
MGAVSTMDRLLAMRLNIPVNMIVNPSSPENFDSCKQTIETERQTLIENKVFRFCENPRLHIKDIQSRIAKFQADIGQKYCIVAIDLITMIQEFVTTKNGTNSAFQIEVAINEMNALAKEMDVHIIGVAQLNRTVESDKIHDIEDLEKFRPTRNSIKNSGALLERTRYCLGLFRPKYYAETYLGESFKDEIAMMADEVFIYLLKQNMGEVGRYKMLFAPDICKMIYLVDDLAKQAETE